MEIVYRSLLVVVIVVGLFCSKSNCFNLDEEDIFNAMDFGVVACPDIDNSRAFIDAWNAACNKGTSTCPMILIQENMSLCLNSDGRTSNTAGFKVAMEFLSKFKGRGGGSQLNDPKGKWLTGCFNLTSDFTMFLE